MLIYADVLNLNLSVPLQV